MFIAILLWKVLLIFFVHFEENINFLIGFLNIFA